MGSLNTDSSPALSSSPYHPPSWVVPDFVAPVSRNLSVTFCEYQQRPVGMYLSAQDILPAALMPESRSLIAQLDLHPPDFASVTDRHSIRPIVRVPYKRRVMVLQSL